MQRNNATLTFSSMWSKKILPDFYYKFIKFCLIFLHFQLLEKHFDFAGKNLQISFYRNNY